MSSYSWPPEIIQGSGSGVVSVNSDTTAAQILATGTTGTDFAIVDNGTGTHTFNLPSASATARGLVTTGTQTIAGAKTFSSTPIVGTLAPSDNSTKAASTAYVTAAVGGGGGGGITGPGSSVVGDVATWSNTGGTALADSNKINLATSGQVSINGNLIFSPSANRTIAPADINTASGTMANFNTRIVAVSNTNVGGSAPSGTLSLLAGGSPGGPVANLLIGSAYNGPGGAGPGDYYFAAFGVFDNDVPTKFGLRVYNPDTVAAPGTGGNVGDIPTNFWQITPGIGGSVYKFGTNNMEDMIVDGDHGYGIPTFRHLTVFDGTPSAAFNGDVANAALNAYLGAQNASGVQPFLGAYVGAVGIGFASGDSRTSITTGTITKKAGSGTLTINADTVTITNQIRVASLGVGNSATATVAVGVLAKKIEVFDTSGSSLGFVPLYATIT